MSQYSAAARGRSPRPVEESRAGGAYLEVYPIVCPIAVALNRAALYFPLFSRVLGTPVRCTSTPVGCTSFCATKLEANRSTALETTFGLRLKKSKKYTHF